MNWNRCSVCGRFIAYDDFLDGKAKNIMVCPESLCTSETYDVYHTECKKILKSAPA